MPYKRPNVDKPKKPHPLQEDFGIYDQLHTGTDQGWLVPHLTELHDDGRFSLHQFSRTIDDVKKADYSAFKDHVAKEKREETVLKTKRAVMSFLKKHISKAKSNVEAEKNKILRVTEPDNFSDPIKALKQELRFQEIRNIVRNADPKHRHNMIAGNLEFIQAMIDAPDDIIDKKHLTEIRREYAFSKDPSLAEEEKDTVEIYKSVRARAGEISATASKMLIYAKLDDPTPPTEHFEVFEPETDYEKHLAEKHIQSYQKAQDQIEREKKFAEKDTGINLEIQQRKEKRLKRG